MVVMAAMERRQTARIEAWDGFISDQIQYEIEQKKRGEEWKAQHEAWSHQHFASAAIGGIAPQAVKEEVQERERGWYETRRLHKPHGSLPAALHHWLEESPSSLAWLS
jgi:hypothetical protein